MISKSPLRVRLSNTHVLTGEKATVWAELRVKAPKLDSKAAERSAVPTDIALVLDCSGSMGGGPNSPLDFAGQAAGYVLGQLGPEDRCAVIGYGSEVRTLHALSSEHQAGTSAVRRLPSLGMTAMAAGLEEAARQLAASGPERPKRIFLLSDGHANVGVSDPAGLADLTASLRAQHGITFSTFGVGAGFNEDLMEKIAVAGAGGYHFIEHADAIPAAFTDELRGLLAVTLTDATVRFTVGKQVKAGEVLGPDADEQVIKLGDLPAGAVRRALVELALPKLSAGRPVIDVRLQARTAEGEAVDVSADAQVQVSSDSDVVAAGVNEKVMARVVELQAAAAEAEAAKAAAQGDLERARNLIGQSMQSVEAYAAAAPATANLLAERREALTASVADLADFDASSAKRMKFRSYRSRTSR